MWKKRSVYYAVNILIFIFSALWIINYYGNIQIPFAEWITPAFCITVCSVILVHLLKSIRLYFALLGNKISLITYWKQYCKVTPLCMMLPLKVGEIFRMYCYAYQIGNFWRGMLIVLMDRFMDTMALVTVIFVLWMIRGVTFSTLFLVLFAFVFCVIFFYLIFPSIYHYWKTYLLKSKASHRKIWALKALTYFHNIYIEVKNVVYGKGSILYLLSLTSWIVEIGSLKLLNPLKNDMLMIEYLNAALKGTEFILLQQFVFASTCVMLAAYCILWVAAKHTEKEVK